MCVSAKSLPIHCIVEHHRGPGGDRGASDIDLDTYAILPSSTMFSEIVRTALTKLGYTAAEAMGAKGNNHVMQNVTISTII